MTNVNLDQSFGGGLDRKTGSLISKSLPKDGGRAWRVTDQPLIEPVTVGEVKEFARIDGGDEDGLLEGFIQAVRMATEEYLGRALIEQTITMRMDYWATQVITLPRPPLISVASIVTADEDDAETVYSSDNYYVVTEAIPGKIILKQSVSAPTNTARDTGGFIIRYKAGYGDSAIDVPAPIREGIKVWTSVFQATRALDPKNPPPEARGMLDLFRVTGVLIR